MAKEVYGTEIGTTETGDVLYGDITVSVEREFHDMSWDPSSLVEEEGVNVLTVRVTDSEGVTQQEIRLDPWNSSGSDFLVTVVKAALLCPPRQHQEFLKALDTFVPRPSWDHFGDSWRS